MVGLAVGILLIIVPLEKVKSQQWRWLLVSIGVVTVGVSLLTTVGPSLNRLLQVL